MRIAAAMMLEPDGRHYGYSLMSQTGLLSGTLYPILDRMLADGWAVSSWELPEPGAPGKPRRYYVLTDVGRRELTPLADGARRDRGLNLRLRVSPAGS